MSAPRIRFVIGGVQKGGTTALAQFMAQHPMVALPEGKEAHVFDAQDFDEAWSVGEIDARYAAHFPQDAALSRLHGDATPLYCFHPALVRRIAKYNPGMRWILMLRHPVERAISHYQMERERGHERWPMWAAMSFEALRLRGHADDFSAGSPLRRHSYLARGDYARQLDVLLAHFPREQILLLHNEQLSESPALVLDSVWAFLGLPAPERSPEFARVFEGRYRRVRAGSALWCWLGWLLRKPMRDARLRHGIDWRQGVVPGAEKA